MLFTSKTFFLYSMTVVVVTKTAILMIMATTTTTTTTTAAAAAASAQKTTFLRGVDVGVGGRQRDLSSSDGVGSHYYYDIYVVNNFCAEHVNVGLGIEYQNQTTTKNINNVDMGTCVFVGQADDKTVDLSINQVNMGEVSCKLSTEVESECSLFGICSCTNNFADNAACIVTLCY